MDLQRVTMLGAIGDLHFGIGVVTGLDRVWEMILPEDLWLKRIGDRVLKHLISNGYSLDKHITFGLPDGRVFEVIVVKVPWEYIPTSGIDRKVHEVRPWRGADLAGHD